MLTHRAALSLTFKNLQDHCLLPLSSVCHNFVLAHAWYGSEPDQYRSSSSLSSAVTQPGNPAFATSTTSSQRSLEALNASVDNSSSGETAPELLGRKRRRVLPDHGPGLAHFLAGSSSSVHTTLPKEAPGVQEQRVYVETYGCQMNVSDTEVLLSVLADHGFKRTDSDEDADVVLLNTCAIRENAESKIWARLGWYKNMKRARRAARRQGPVVGVLGCMAERLKEKLLEEQRAVDLVVGPDALRDVPRLIAAVQGADGAGGVMNVQLSAEETYADIVPLRAAGQSAYLSIMRGCNNMCAFCIVPFTRGRERSRPRASILDEVRMLSEQGVREVTLLGQNVNSYADFSEAGGPPRQVAGEEQGVYAEGFASVYRPKRGGAVSFAALLDSVAAVDPEMRIRFTSPHPKDFADDVLQVIAERPNVCKQLHMPAQSGSTSMLARMRRGYSREAYDALLERVRGRIPGVGISTDIIVGFCGETEEEHAATVDLMRAVRFEQAFMFAYSERDKTRAARHMQDDVAPQVKQVRLEEVIAAFRGGLAELSAAEVGREHLVLVEGPSRRSQQQLTGRTCSNRRVLFDDLPVPFSLTGGPPVQLQPGDYVAVRIQSGGTQTLHGRALARTTLREFVALHGTTLPQAPAEWVPPALQAAAA